MFNGGQKITNAAVAAARVKLNNEIAAGVRQSQLDNIQTQSTNRRLEKQLREKADNAEYYDWLLHQPIEVMARQHGVFRNNLENFLKQREDYSYRQYYEDLLCKPMHEIAQKNGKFQETYEAQMTLMANWMVSQKAFKELAIEFGLEKGQSAEETIQQGFAKKIDVLENKHNPSHNTIVGDSPIIGPRRQKLIDKIIKTKANK